MQHSSDFLASWIFGGLSLRENNQFCKVAALALLKCTVKLLLMDSNPQPFG